jgi:hypothetical protein
MDHIILNDEVELIEVVVAPDDDERQYLELVDKWDMLEFEDYDGDIVTGAQFEEADEEEEEENIAMRWMSKERVTMYRELIMTEIIHP